MRRVLAAVGAGIAGAVAVTLLNEVGRQLDDRAPRLDLLGERALAKTLRRLGARRPRPRKLRRLALAADLFANSLFYGVLFAGRPRPWLRGALGGAIAGVSAPLLAPALGIERRGRKAQPVPALSVAWYTGAGLAASAVYKALAPRRAPRTQSLPISRAAL